jgi:hypothetical protein
MNTHKLTSHAYHLTKLMLLFIIVLGITLPLSLSYAGSIPAPIDNTKLDKLGVDLLSGLPTVKETTLTIGHDDLSLRHELISHAGSIYSFFDLTSSYIFTHKTAYGEEAKVRIGTFAHDLHKGPSGNTFTPFNEDGSTLIRHSPSHYVYTQSDGTVYESVYSDNHGKKTLTYPNGFTLDITREAITSNNGLQLRFTRGYRSDGSSYLKRVTGINLAQVTCNQSNSDCGLHTEWPSVRFDYDDDNVAVGQTYRLTITKPEGERIRFVNERMNMERQPDVTPHRLIAVYRNNSSRAVTTYEYEDRYTCSGEMFTYMISCTEPKLVLGKATHYGVEYRYHNNTPSGPYTAITGSVSGENGGYFASTTYLSYKGNRGFFSNSSWTGGGATYSLDSKNRITHFTDKGLSFTYRYNQYGDIIERKRVNNAQAAVPGRADVVETAGYDTVCSADTIKYCRKPTYYIDENGNQTDYSYHSASGYVSKIIQPADSKGVSPVTFMEYEALYAKYKNASGEVTQASTPIWRLTKKTQCISQAATDTGCQEGDALVTYYDYGQDRATTNLWLASTKVVAPDGESRLTCFYYDALGRQNATISPDANLSSCPL